MWWAAAAAAFSFLPSCKLVRKVDSTTCTANSDCFSDERCCSGTCVVTTTCAGGAGDAGDAGNAGDGGGTDPSVVVCWAPDAGADVEVVAGTTTSPRVTIDESGIPTIAWLLSNDAGAVRVRATRPGILGPVDIETQDGSAASLEMAGGESRDAITAWTLSSGGTTRTRAVRLVAPDWDAGVRDLSAGAPSATVASVKVHPIAGNGAVAWIENGDAGWASLFDPRDGGAWRTTNIVNAPSVRSLAVATSDLTAFGPAAAAWVVAQPGGDKQLLVRLAIDGGTWLPDSIELASTSPTFGDPESPAVAVNRNNIAVVVWSQQSGGVRTVFVSLFSGGWIPPSAIDPDSGAHGVQPLVVLHEVSDTAIVAWLRTAPTAAVDSPRDVYARRLLDGVWQSPVQLFAATNGKSARNLALASNPNSDAVAAWDDDAGQVLATRFSTQRGAWGVAQAMSTTTKAGFGPRVAINVGARGVIAWTEQIGAYQRVVFTACEP